VYIHYSLGFYFSAFITEKFTGGIILQNWKGKININYYNKMLNNGGLIDFK